jgi:hypothetical protein
MIHFPLRVFVSSCESKRVFARRHEDTKKVWDIR